MDENLVKGFKLKNGDIYKYDYETLGNKPFYDIITVGDVIIPETTCYFERDSGGVFVTTGMTASQSLLEYSFIPGKNYLLYIDDKRYIVYQCGVSSESGNIETLYLRGLYDSIFMFVDGDQVFMQLVINIIGEHTIKLCAIESEDIKLIDLKNSRIIKRIYISNLPYDANYYSTDKNLSSADLIGYWSHIEEGIGNIIGVKENYGTDRSIELTMYDNSNPGNFIYLKYNPDTGNAVQLDKTISGSSCLYNVADNAEIDLGENDFTGATLFYDNSSESIESIINQVLVLLAYGNEDSILLYSADRYLYESDGETIAHDFSIGPIEYNTLTGSFTLNHGESN